MNIKNIISAVCSSVMLFSCSVANSAIIDNGLYTSDTATGLDWLDLSVTVNQSYNSAKILNPGWRHATNAEVENIVATLFDGYYDTDPYGYSDGEGGAYTGQHADFYEFYNLFGATYNDPNYLDSFALYKDEGDVLRVFGAQVDLVTTVTYIYGTEYGADYDYLVDVPQDWTGVFMVRETLSPVPVTAAVWLFGSGFLGLIGVARRKKAA